MTEIDWQNMDPSEWPHTPPHEELRKYIEARSNNIWRLSSGDLVNALEEAYSRLDDVADILSESFLDGKFMPAYVGAPDRARIAAIERVMGGTSEAPHTPVPSSDDLILAALLRVREIGNAGQAGPYVHRLPSEKIPNWGWLQGQWAVVVAVDVAQQAYEARLSRLKELSAKAHTYGPDEFGAFKRELAEILRSEDA